MTYSFSIWIPATAAAIAIMAAAIGVFLYVRKRSRDALIICGFIAALAGGLLAPMLAMDKVVLDERKLEQTTGFWFDPTVKGFSLEHLSSITIETVRAKKNRSHDVWIGTLDDGSRHEVDPGDLWDMNGEDIALRLRARGIRVTDNSE